MIKHSGDVINAVRLFCNPEEEIVVLCAIKLRAETAHLLYEFSAYQCEMADVITGEEIVR